MRSIVQCFLLCSTLSIFAPAAYAQESRPGDVSTTDVIVDGHGGVRVVPINANARDELLADALRPLGAFMQVLGVIGIVDCLTAGVLVIVSGSQWEWTPFHTVGLLQLTSVAVMYGIEIRIGRRVRIAGRAIAP